MRSMISNGVLVTEYEVDSADLDAPTRLYSRHQVCRMVGTRGSCNSASGWPVAALVVHLWSLDDVVGAVDAIRSDHALSRVDYA